MTQRRPRSGPLERLLVAAASGDRTAFAELYDALAPLVYGLVRSIVADQDQAADVTGAAFVEMWSRAGQFDPQQGSAQSWSLATAHLLAVRHRRDQRVAAGQPAAEPGWDALRLAYLGGLTEREISARMSTSPDTTRGLITDSLVSLSRRTR